MDTSRQDNGHHCLQTSTTISLFLIHPSPHLNRLFTEMLLLHSILEKGVATSVYGFFCWRTRQNERILSEKPSKRLCLAYYRTEGQRCERVYVHTGRSAHSSSSAFPVVLL